jgi:hypothetical protein
MPDEDDYERLREEVQRNFGRVRAVMDAVSLTDAEKEFATRLVQQLHAVAMAEFSKETNRIGEVQMKLIKATGSTGDVKQPRALAVAAALASLLTFIDVWATGADNLPP